MNICKQYGLNTISSYTTSLFKENIIQASSGEAGRIFKIVAIAMSLIAGLYLAYDRFWKENTQGSNKANDSENKSRIMSNSLAKNAVGPAKDDDASMIADLAETEESGKSKKAAIDKKAANTAKAVNIANNNVKVNAIPAKLSPQLQAKKNEKASDDLIASIIANDLYEAEKTKAKAAPKPANPANKNPASPINNPASPVNKRKFDIKIINALDYPKPQEAINQVNQKFDSKFGFNSSISKLYDNINTKEQLILLAVKTDNTVVGIFNGFIQNDTVSLKMSVIEDFINVEEMVEIRLMYKAIEILQNLGKKYLVIEDKKIGTVKHSYNYYPHFLLSLLGERRIQQVNYDPDDPNNLDVKPIYQYNIQNFPWKKTKLHWDYPC